MKNIFKPAVNYVYRVLINRALCVKHINISGLKLLVAV
jgi:hypothetical protein